MMVGRKLYSIEQPATGVVLFEGEADSAEHALDLMAREAGYGSFDEVPVYGGRLVVTDEHGNRHES